jgi:hypothetical protein
MNRYVAVGLSVLVGAAMIEVALVPGIDVTLGPSAPNHFICTVHRHSFNGSARLWA